jgi:hypothetical protein
VRSRLCCVVLGRRAWTRFKRCAGMEGEREWDGGYGVRMGIGRVGMGR